MSFETAEKESQESPDSARESSGGVLVELASGLEQDLDRIKASQLDKIDSTFVQEITVNIANVIETEVEKSAAPETNDALGRVQYLLEHSDLPQEEQVLELSKALDSLQVSLEDAESEHADAIQKIVEGVQNEFDPKQPERNDVSMIQSIAHKVQLDLKNLRYKGVSQGLRGVLGRCEYLQENADTMPKEQVELELSNILGAVQEEVSQ